MHRLHCEHVYFNGIDAHIWYKPIKFYRIHFQCFEERWSWWWPKWWSYSTMFSISLDLHTHTLVTIIFFCCTKQYAIFWIFCSSFCLLSNGEKREMLKITIWMKRRFRRTLFKQTKCTANRILTNKKTFRLS